MPGKKWFYAVFPRYNINFVSRLLICVWFSSHLRNLHWHGDVTITIEELHILTNVRPSWPLGSETLVYNGHFSGLLTFTPVAESLAVKLSLPVYAIIRLDLSRLRIEYSTFSMRGESSNRLRTRHVYILVNTKLHVLSNATK